MSTYDGSIIKVGTNLDLQRLITELTGSLPAKLTAQVANASTISTSSGSDSTMSTLTVNCAIDEAIVFVSQTLLSCGTANIEARVQHRINFAAVQNFATYKGPADTTGESGTVTNISMIGDIAGAVSFDVMWALVAGTGTIYSSRRIMSAISFKRR